MSECERTNKWHIFTHKELLRLGWAIENGMNADSATNLDRTTHRLLRELRQELLWRDDVKVQEATKD